MDLYSLHHVHEFGDGDEDVKLIGIYSSKENAEAAIERVRNQPGFREHPGGFQISRCILDKDYWTEGFVTEKQLD